MRYEKERCLWSSDRIRLKSAMTFNKIINQRIALINQRMIKCENLKSDLKRLPSLKKKERK